MRKVLALTVALMIAAIVIMPAFGYTNQAAGNQSYSAKSGEKTGYSFTTGSAAHNLTAGTLTNAYSLKSAGVVSTRQPYTFKQGGAQAYTFKTLGVDNAVAAGLKVKKDTALLGSMNKKAEPEVVEPPVIDEPKPPVVTKYSIEGMVVDENNTGLENWTVNLEGAATNSMVTGADGKFAFAGLDAGAYEVSEVLMEGWNKISPVEDKIAVAISNANVTDLVFTNQLVPVVITPPAENATGPANETINATNNSSIIV